MIFEAENDSSLRKIVRGQLNFHHVAWYQTDVWVPARWSGQRIVLRFDAATHRATVWVNDTEVAEHEGGYTPFEADVTTHLHAGA